MEPLRGDLHASYAGVDVFVGRHGFNLGPMLPPGEWPLWWGAYGRLTFFDEPVPRFVVESLGVGWLGKTERLRVFDRANPAVDHRCGLLAGAASIVRDVLAAEAAAPSPSAPGVAPGVGGAGGAAAAGAAPGHSDGPSGVPSAPTVPVPPGQGADAAAPTTYDDPAVAR